MNGSVLLKCTLAATVAVGALCTGVWRAEAANYSQTNLASDIPGLAAIPDPNLKNTWGVSNLPGSPFWISNQGTNTSSLFVVTGSTNVSAGPLSVDIPTTSGPAQGPTGQVANSSSSFAISGGKAFFIFANLNGTISAWNLSNINGTTNAATIEATTPGAVFTGLAIDSPTNPTPLLYAANGATGAIDVFNGSFAPVSLGPNAFKNPFTGLVPFNVRDIDGKVYVTYAPAGHAAQTDAALGQGGVAVFDESGNLLQTLINGSQLAAPWGVALAPATFGQFGGDLLVGNFSFDHSEINAFDPATGAFKGTIPIDPGLGNAPGGLWDLIFGSGDPNTLYFTDGLNGEADGLFGAITVPEPSTWALVLIGLGGMGLVTTGRRRSRLACA